MEYQEEYQWPVQKYEEVRWNTKRHWQTNRVNSCPDSGCIKFLRDDAKPGANAMKWHQQGTPRSPKAHKNRSKFMPKRPKILKMTPGGKRIICSSILDRFGAPVWESADPSAVGVSDFCPILQIPQMHTNPYSTKFCSSLILPILPVAWYYHYHRYYR